MRQKGFTEKLIKLVNELITITRVARFRLLSTANFSIFMQIDDSVLLTAHPLPKKRKKLFNYSDYVSIDGARSVPN